MEPSTSNDGPPDYDGYESDLNDEPAEEQTMFGGKSDSDISTAIFYDFIVNESFGLPNAKCRICEQTFTTMRDEDLKEHLSNTHMLNNQPILSDITRENIGNFYDINRLTAKTICKMCGKDMGSTKLLNALKRHILCNQHKHGDSSRIFTKTIHGKNDNLSAAGSDNSCSSVSQNQEQITVPDELTDSNNDVNIEQVDEENYSADEDSQEIADVKAIHVRYFFDYVGKNFAICRICKTTLNNKGSISLKMHVGICCNLKQSDNDLVKDSITPVNVRNFFDITGDAEYAICKICHQILPNSDKLMYHLTNVHMNIGYSFILISFYTIKQNRRATCRLCTVAFEGTRDFNLLRHLKLVHQISADLSINLDEFFDYTSVAMVDEKNLTIDENYAADENAPHVRDFFDKFGTNTKKCRICDALFHATRTAIIPGLKKHLYFCCDFRRNALLKDSITTENAPNFFAIYSSERVTCKLCVELIPKFDKNLMVEHLIDTHMSIGYSLICDSYLAKPQQYHSFFDISKDGSSVTCKLCKITLKRATNSILMRHLRLRHNKESFFAMDNERLCRDEIKLDVQNHQVIDRITPAKVDLWCINAGNNFGKFTADNFK